MVMLCLYVLAVAAPLEVQPRTLSRAGREPLSLPFVVGADAVAERINTVLYVTLLSIPPPVGEAPLSGDGDAKWYKTLGFTVARNDDRVLELVIAGETCGTSCEEVRRILTFDVRTGRSVDLLDVFTPAGQQAIAIRMKAERVRRYRDQVRRYARYKDDRFSELGNKLTFNEACLKTETKHDTPVESLAAAFGAKGVTLTAERCGTPAMREYDDVGDVSLTLSYGDAKVPLAPYGKALLLGIGDAAPPSSPFGQALRGTIGDAGATLVLARPNRDGTVTGHYFYDKRRATIPLRGRVEKDGTLQLTESATTRFVLTPAGASLIGRWSDSRRSAEVRFEAR